MSIQTKSIHEIRDLVASKQASAREITQSTIDAIAKPIPRSRLFYTSMRKPLSRGPTKSIRLSPAERTPVYLAACRYP